ncbi:P-loop containing nucleoside triphosphate hydrolase protein [Nemania sp. NC0429]|nr:P-loop containing nucleoside triphosphate hydrolase protein [Nemania sp. NC0429]
MPNRDETIGSMILSEEEARYFRALLAWRPSDEEGPAAKKTAAPERPLAGYFRVLILGSKGCGKTAILTRFCKDTFFTGEGQPPPPRAEYERGGGGGGGGGCCQRNIEVAGQTYAIDALELGAGQLLAEEQHLRHAVAITDAAVLVYDVRSRGSFAQVRELHRRIREALVLDGRQHYYGLVLVGNKADGDGDGADEEEKEEGEEEESCRRAVTEAEGYELACSLGGGSGRSRCAFRETSARTGENVDSLFAMLGAELLRLRQLAQQRREEAEEIARMEAAMGRIDGDGSDKSPKKAARWRFWARSRSRRVSGDAARKAVVA